MKVKQTPLDQIKPYPGNPRKNAAAIRPVAESIEAFGFQQPIVIDAEGVIIIGHTRYLAAKRLKLARVPVVVADLDATKAKALRLADNRLGEIADWDNAALAGEIAELQLAEFDLGLLGFGQDEIARLLMREADATEAGPTVPATPKRARSKPGEVYQLGDHRLACGDSTDAELLARLMGGTKARLLLTDPPYGVSYEGKTADKLKVANDTLTGDNLRELLSGAFAAADTHLADGAAFYVWFASWEHDAFTRSVNAQRWSVKQELIWIKQRRRSRPPRLPVATRAVPVRLEARHPHLERRPPREDDPQGEGALEAQPRRRAELGRDHRRRDVHRPRRQPDR